MILSPGDVTLILFYLSGIAMFPVLVYCTIRRSFGPFGTLAFLLCSAVAAHFVWANVAAFVGDRAEARFKAADPGHPDAAFAGRSLYIPNPNSFALAAWRCPLTLDHDCEIPAAHWLHHGGLDFLEVGTDPIRRLTLTLHDPGCFSPGGGFDLNGFGDPIISPPHGVCLRSETTEAPRAAYRFDTERLAMRPGKGAHATRAELVEVATGAVLARFDGWYEPRTYGAPAPDPARGPGPMIMPFLSAPTTPEWPYEPAGDLAIMARAGLDEPVLVAALQASRQNVAARAIWFACNGAVLPRLSAETRAAMDSAGKRAFSAPDWRFPESCAARFR